MPAMERKNMNHLSDLDACRIKLSRLANTKNSKNASQNRIQNGVMNWRKITVKAMAAVNQSTKLKINGGSKNINWKIENTMTMDDIHGYRTTNCPRSFGSRPSSSFSLFLMAVINQVTSNTSKTKITTLP